MSRMVTAHDFVNCGCHLPYLEDRLVELNVKHPELTVEVEAEVEEQDFSCHNE